MRKSCILLFSALLLLLFWPAGVRGQEEGGKDDSLDAVIEEIALDVSAIRGIEFDGPVQYGIKTKDELREYLKKLIKEELPGDKLLADQKALAKFGLIPPDMHLETFLLELYTEQVVGFYDWRTKTLYLIDDIPENMLRPVISHELTHALQDQYVGIENLPIFREKENDDRIMATQALLEGDANSVMIDYALKPMGRDSTMLPNIEPLIEEFTSTMGGRLMTSAPAFIRSNVLFPYINGFTFIQQLRQSGGWAQVNRLLEHPPQSTEQVLHPEKYFAEADSPTTITLPQLSKELGKGWTLLGENTLGEFNTSMLLDEFLEDAPETTASGWDGDLYQVYEHEPSGEVALVWFTTWDGPGDAQEFFAGYASVLAKKYGSEGVSGTEQYSLVFTTREDDGTPVTQAHIALRESDVVVLDGVPRASIDAVKASALSEEPGTIR